MLSFFKKKQDVRDPCPPRFPVDARILVDGKEVYRTVLKESNLDAAISAITLIAREKDFTPCTVQVKWDFVPNWS